MSDSRDRGLHSYYGGYGYNQGGGYGGYPGGGYPPVAYPPPSGYPPQAAYHGQHQSGHGGQGAVAGYGAGHMMHSHNHADGGFKLLTMGSITVAGTEGSKNGHNSTYCG